MLLEPAYLFAASLSSDVLTSGANICIRSLDPIPSPDARCVYIGSHRTYPVKLFKNDDFTPTKGVLARFGQHLLKEHVSKHTRKRGLLRARERLAADLLGRGDTVITAPEVRSYSVYVVLLAPAVREKPSVQDDNPDGDPNMPCVYVGFTGMTPYERFLKHKQCGKSSVQLVCEHGVRLLPALYSHLNPMTEYDALLREARLAAFLRSRGYWVMGGH